jgi:IclR family transcriptional regulator, acetate operon repressor
MSLFVGKVSDNDKTRTTLRTAERALAFLQAVAEAPRPPRLKDVTATIGVNITTGYHLLNTLQQAGYLTKESDGTLRIGWQVEILHQGMLRHFVLGRDLHPVIEELAARTGETAYVAGLSKDGVVIQALVEASQAVRVTGHHVGFSGAEHIRASGKAVLAHLDDHSRDRILARCMGDAPPKARQAVFSELASVRQQGWALDEGEYQEGVCCAATAFFRSGGVVAGSITVSAPATRFSTARDFIVEAVQAAARQASARLGHRLGQTEPSIL